jgi:hypothetical protein
MAVPAIKATMLRRDHIVDPCDYCADPDPQAMRTRSRRVYGRDAFSTPPPTAVLPIQRNHILNIPKGPLRADLRAVTPLEFTRAVYLFNRAE